MSTYDFKKVSLVVNGAIMTGFHDGTAITATKNADNTAAHVGADGDVTYSETNDNTGTITFILKQTSASLKGIITLSKTTAPFAAKLTDMNGNILAGGSRCRILRTPEISFASGVSGVTVNVHVADYSLT